MAIERDVFHKYGHRLTKQRKILISALSDKPQSVDELFQSLKNKGVAIDMATIYRSLDCLVRIGMVGKTQFSRGSAKFELLVGTHHHHAVCNSCGSVEDVPINDEKMLHKISQKMDFRITNHVMEFFGLCKKCQNRGIRPDGFVSGITKYG
jgi:Fe2+ or Zn2+ uptake regulation protein